MINPNRIRDYIISQLQEQPTRAGEYIIGKIGKTKSQRGTESTARIDPNQLEIVYNKDPIAFNGTNLLVRTILSTPHRIEPALKRDTKITEAILPQRKLDKILRQTFKHGIIFGHAWYEKLKDKSGKLVDLEVLDPKSMDYLRDDYGNVLYDQTGRQPQSYVQYIPQNVAPVDGEIRVGSKRAIPLALEDIVHFKFNEVSDSSLGVGFIEPLYNTIKNKMNIEQGLSQSIIRHGFPIFHAKLGDERHEPLPDQIDEMYESLKNLDESTELVTPYYNEIQILESKQTTDTAQHLSYFIDQQIAGMGVPRPLVTGGGEATNRSVLERQQIIFQQTIKDLQETVSTTFEEQVLAKLAEDYGLSGTPELMWEDTNIESITAKAERLQGYSSVGLLIADKPIRDYIREKERLPVETKEDMVETKPPEANKTQGNPKKIDSDEKDQEKEKLQHREVITKIKDLDHKIQHITEKLATQTPPPISVNLELPKPQEPKVDLEEEYIKEKIRQKKNEVLDKLIAAG